MQTVLVIIVFIVAAGFLVKKFIWNPSSAKNKKGKCGGKDCGCH